MCELRSGFGLMAFHGGNLERTTDVIAREAAERTGASLYAVIQHAPLRESTCPRSPSGPEHSAKLKEFLDHVHTVVAVHGYGRGDPVLERAAGRTQTDCWPATSPSTCGPRCRPPTA